LFSPKNEYKSATERSEAASIGLQNPNRRFILKIDRTEFYPRPPAAGSGQESKKSVRLRPKNFKMSKNLKTNRIEPHFVAKEIFL
jgi:hypothetical protein